MQSKLSTHYLHWALLILAGEPTSLYNMEKARRILRSHRIRHHGLDVRIAQAQEASHAQA